MRRFEAFAKIEFLFDLFRLKSLLQLFTLFCGNTKNFKLIFFTYRLNCICAKKELFWNNLLLQKLKNVILFVISVLEDLLHTRTFAQVYFLCLG